MRLIPNCKLLKRLAFSSEVFYPNISKIEQHIPHIVQIPNLQILDLRACLPIAGRVNCLNQLVLCKSVTSLHLPGSDQTDLRCITQMPAVQEFTFVSPSGISGKNLQYITSCGHIRSLGLPDIEFDERRSTSLVQWFNLKN